MIQLERNRLTFCFPEVHRKANLTITLQRTLRIPDNNKTYPLPPSLGEFPLKHVDDYAANVPAEWLQRGGVMLPMYQAEAMWLRFSSTTVERRRTSYPFAIKVATGKQCAVTGQSWTDGLQRNPQNYMTAPQQPWLDGYAVEKGVIRQFVAMPLGAGYSAEEQLTGQAEFGGLQIAVYPMKADAFDRRFPEQEQLEVRQCRMASRARSCVAPDMGLAPGGRMRQEIYDDPFDLNDWETDHTSRCFVHLCNSLVWNSMTGTNPPHPPPTAKQYHQARLPWFDYYDDNATAIRGSNTLAGMKSVATMSSEKNDHVLPENESITPENLVVYRKGLSRSQVREGTF